MTARPYGGRPARRSRSSCGSRSLSMCLVRWRSNPASRLDAANDVLICVGQPVGDFLLWPRDDDYIARSLVMIYCLHEEIRHKSTEARSSVRPLRARSGECRSGLPATDGSWRDSHPSGGGYSAHPPKPVDQLTLAATCAA